MKSRSIVPFLFFASGATALVYEVIWSKYLGQMMGSTIHAQTIVLAVFMGGLAVGNSLFGRRASATRDPLALYGILELAIGLYGFFFPWIFEFGDRLFVSIATGMLEREALLISIKASVSVGLLILPTILMGGTLPLLAAWLQQHDSDYARVSARFYSINSLGAVFGSALGGFYLVRNLGMVSALQATGLVNVAIWIVALGLSRMGSTGLRTRNSGEPRAEVGSEDPKVSNVKTACFLVALTGGVSMGLEVLAARSLSLLFGASLHAFAVVLIGFILGIGIGSAVIASPRFRRLPVVGTLVGLLACASLFVGVGLLFVDDWAEVYRHLRSGIARTTMGYRFHLLLNASIAVVVLGIPAGLIGATVPLFIREQNGENIAARVGKLLTWNTVGAVMGVLIAGFVLMPYLGLRRSFAFMACVLGLVSVITSFGTRSLFPKAVGCVALVVGLFPFARGNTDWQYLFSSGMFRNRETEVIGRVVQLRKQLAEILFYKDGPDATVSVERNREGTPSQRVLRVNGKPDASSRGDLSTQYLLAHLPMLAKPDAQDVFVLGFGSGITAGAVTGHPIQSLTIAENCQPVLEASKYFETWNRGILTNKLARVLREDARTVLKLDPKLYDIIISEPSNPWMAGVGSVFSVEFYKIAASRIKEGGVFAQWFHIYEINDQMVFLVLRTFSSVFPFLEIWDTGDGDIVLIGAQKPWRTTLPNVKQVFARSKVAADLAEIGIRNPETMFSRLMASTKLAWALAGQGAVQTDAFPLLEYDAPAAFYVGGKSDTFEKLDERTWFKDIADADRKSLLSGVSTEDLRTAFAEFGSINSHVIRYVNMRARGLDTQQHYASAVNANPLPSIFRGDITWNEATPVPKKPTDAEQSLAQAERILMTQPDSWQAAVELINKTLKSRPNDLLPTTAPSPMHYAALGSIRAISKGKLELARELIQAGLVYDPRHAVLNVLLRLASQEMLFP